MVITDSYHNDIEGKDYKYGSPNKVDDKSKPIILFYFLEDYERVWDEGKPIKYDDEELKNNASVSLIDYTDNVLLINLFDYESFDEMELKFQVGKETSIPDVVDENNHSKEYRFTPTKIVVANSLGKDSAVYDEIVTSVWDGYYKTASKEGEKLPKVAENVKNAESYKKCAECSDSVFGLEEEICFECSSFGAESEDCEVCYTTVDKGTLNDVQAGRICNECHRMNQYDAETTMTVEHKDGSKYRYSETDPIYGEMGEIVGHVSEITDEQDTPYQKIYGRKKPPREHNFYHAESSSSLQSFAAEVFEADRKIRRRTRWTWTRGQESGFEVEKDNSELPYDIDYTGRKGRGYYGSYVPIYSVKDSYHISDLPEGYHLHLYKPALRSSSWKAFSKSPTSDWEEYNDYKKSNLTGELLNWYNQDIAKPEQKTLSPIEKLMISKGMKSGTVQIERIVIPKTKYTTEKIQYFAFGGSKLTKRTTPLNFCVIDSGVVSLENVEYEFEPHLFAFAQGLKFMTEKAGTLRSVNRFNKDPEAWVKSYPAWFQNAVKNKLTDIDVEFIGLGVEKYDSGMKINDILVLKFLNGVDRYSWRPINEDKRKVIDTPYGEMPQFEIYELDMNDPAPIIPRPSTMRKIYAKSFKQNLIGDWKFDKEMFMMAVVDKYKFENGGSESIHDSMTNEPIWVIETIPYMTPMAELMARRYKKKLN